MSDEFGDLEGFDDYLENYNPYSDNPFLDPEGIDKHTIPDAFEEFEKQVLDSLGIESFENIVYDIDKAEPSDIRGNRFESIKEAVLYLFDAGVLRFSGVVLDDKGEVAIEIKPRSP